MSCTILDRQRLAQYVGVDPAFEAQYLELLSETIQSCLCSLEQPSSETYGVLHAAKPGLMVATTPTFSDQFAQACDALVGVSAWPLSVELSEMLQRLRLQLFELSVETLSAIGKST